MTEQKQESSTMVCDECGTEADESANFCAKCGARIEKKAETPAPVNNNDTAQEEAGDAKNGKVEVESDFSKLSLSEKIFVCLAVAAVAFFVLDWVLRGLFFGVFIPLLKIFIFL